MHLKALPLQETLHHILNTCDHEGMSVDCDAVIDCTVLADRELLQRILNNLVDDSCKYGANALSFGSACICRSVSGGALNSLHIAAGDHQLIGCTGVPQAVKHDTRELRVCILPFEELLADQHRLHGQTVGQTEQHSAVMVASSDVSTFVLNIGFGRSPTSVFEVGFVKSDSKIASWYRLALLATDANTKTFWAEK